MKKTNLLPKKPSKLLMVAMEDLEKIESMKEVSIDMGKWYTKNTYTGYCSVCHAGAVMYNLIEKNNIQEYDCTDGGVIDLFEPSDFDDKTHNKLEAINEIRMGEIECFFNLLEVDNPWINESGSCLYDCGKDERGLSPDFYSEQKDYSKEDWEVYKNWIVSFIGILQAEGL
jgi:hypothetical protein